MPLLQAKTVRKNIGKRQQDMPVSGISNIKRLPPTFEEALPRLKQKLPAT